MGDSHWNASIHEVKLEWWWVHGGSLYYSICICFKIFLNEELKKTVSILWDVKRIWNWIGKLHPKDICRWVIKSCAKNPPCTGAEGDLRLNLTGLWSGVPKQEVNFYHLLYPNPQWTRHWLWAMGLFIFRWGQKIRHLGGHRSRPLDCWQYQEG